MGTLISRADSRRPAGSLKAAYEAGRINPENPVEIEGELDRSPEPAPDAYYLDLNTEALRGDSGVESVTGRVRLMVPLSTPDAKSQFERLDLDFGARLRVRVRLEQPRVYHNPGSPDFNAILESQGYQLKGVVRSPLSIEKLGQASVNPVLSSLFRWRQQLMRAIDLHFKAPVAGTLKAMLMDNRYFLDSETVDRLREGGTFHIISISGMHVGIIALALLGGMSSERRRRRWWLLIVLAVLWAYAVMVGLAPPVTRATLMISVALIGPLLFRRAASINTVALAAFFMLAVKPALVADPGFQLSFVAVGGGLVLALPFIEKLRSIGTWRPGPKTPHPPLCRPPLRWLAETLFWNERSFRAEMQNSPVRYRLVKSRTAVLLGRLRLQSLVRTIAYLIVASIAVQLATLPLTVVYFNRVTPAGIALNIFAGLLTAVLMGAGVLAITAGTLSSWISALAQAIGLAAHRLLVDSILPFEALPFSSFRVPHYDGWHAVWYGVYFVPLAGLALLIDMWAPVSQHQKGIETPGEMSTIRPLRPESGHAGNRARPLRRAGGWLAVLAVVVSAIVIVHPASPRANGKLTISFLDVGQGDAALVEFPRGTTMLVDAGGELDLGRHLRPTEAPVENGSAGQHSGDETERAEGSEVRFRDASYSVGEAVVSRFLWATGRTRVDYVLATHAHADHIGGLSQVIENFRIGEAILGRRPADNLELNDLQQTIQRHRIPLAEVAEGEKFEIEGVSIEALWPPRPVGPVTSGNNDSVVLRLVYGSVAVMLAGDIERAGEETLVKSGEDLRADVLKVPHHGSKTSSTAAFIDAVGPRCAVISVGERSRFGHPNAEVVSRYVARGIQLFQTGRDGTITVETDGTTLSVSTYRH